MNAENIRYEFPEMPEEIRNMIRCKVEEQINQNGMGEYRKSKADVRSPRRSRRMALAVLAAAMVFGTSALAGVHFYRMYLEKLGAYGAKITVDQGTVIQTEGMAAESSAGEVRFENPTVRAAWIPEGLVEADNGYRFHQEGDYGSGGISIALWDAEGFEITDTFVESAEEIKVSGHEAIYITQMGGADANPYNHGMYISYPEAEMVVQLYLDTNVSREDAIRFAEGLEVVEQDAADQAIKAKTSAEEDAYIRTMRLSASEEEMCNTHQIGEAFVMPYILAETGEGTAELSVKVSEVQVLSDISSLDPAYMDDGLLAQADAEGKLLPNTIQYIKRGDGINTLDEVLESEVLEQRLILASVEYINSGDAVLEDILFYVALMKIQEENGNYSIYKREAKNTQMEYDTTFSSSIASDGRMIYWDVTGGESNGSNYIDRLEPGETVTVHVGFLASEDELDYLYLSPDGGSAYEFSETSLKTGYVDLREAVK